MILTHNAVRRVANLLWVFAKNSLMKSIFEKEKKFDSRT